MPPRPLKRRVVINPSIGSNVPNKRQRRQTNNLNQSLIGASDRNEFFQNVLSGASQQSDDIQATANTTNVRHENAHSGDSSGGSNDSETDNEIISVGTNEASRLTQSEVIISKLDEILIRIAAIEKFQAKTEVRLRNIENSMERYDNGTNETDGNEAVDRARLGLPVKTLPSLDKLEQDLATEENKQQMVRN